MLIINAEVPAGLTIKEAIVSALEFAERNKCMVRVEINDIPMLIANAQAFGTTFDKRVETFLAQYQFELKNKFKEEESA